MIPAAPTTFLLKSKFVDALAVIAGITETAAVTTAKEAAIYRVFISDNSSRFIDLEFTLATECVYFVFIFKNY